MAMQSNKGGFSTDSIMMAPQFNMALPLILRIDKRQDNADIFAIEGDIMRHYRCVMVLYVICDFKINEHKDKYKKDIDEIDKLLKKVEGVLEGVDSKAKQMNLSGAEKELFTIRKLINRILYEEGLLYPKKPSWTIEEEVGKDFE